jgi:GT2 family glycosyltransferase
MSTGDLKLSVIVLFYHGERWIKACLESLENQSLAPSLYEIILVDNGGSTPSVGNYDKHPHTKVLYLEKNFGFAGGNNMALAHTEGNLVMLMNQDVVVHFNCLDEIVKAFDRYPHAGVISANMLMVSQKDNVDPHRPFNEIAGQYRLTRLGYASYVTTKTNKDLIPVDFVSGNALCFRKSILKDVRNYLFDSRLESYAEDLDLTLRLKSTDWRMFVCRKALVYHYRDDAFSGSPLNMLRKLFHVSSNRLLVYYNNLSTKDFLLKLPILTLGIPFKVARPDGAAEFNLPYFLAALGCVPLIVSYFAFKAFKLSKIELSKQDST